MADLRSQPKERKGTAQVQQPINPALANFARLIREAAELHRSKEAEQQAGDKAKP